MNKFHCLIAFTFEMLGKMCIEIIFLQIFEIISFEINLSFVIKRLSYMTKKSWQKGKYFKNEKSFNIK